MLYPLQSVHQWQLEIIPVEFRHRGRAGYWTRPEDRLPVSGSGLASHRSNTTLVRHQIPELSY